MTDTRSRPENATALHTPGPWIVFAADGEFDVLPAMRSGAIACIASNHASADASLIAAAPDMLAALKSAEAALDVASAVIDADDCVEASLQVRGTLLLVIAAIAKANSQ